MKALSKLVFPLAALLSLAGCGGGGGGNGSGGGAFNGGTYSLTIAPSATSLAQNSKADISVTVKNPDGTTVSNGLAVSLTVTPTDIGTVGATSSSTSSTATSSTSGGIAAFVFLSAAKGGTAHLVASVQNSNGTASTTSVDIAVSSTTVNDPRLQLTASATTLPLNPFNPEDGSQGFPGNYLGSPYISEVTLQWRHSNGQLVSGTLKANVSVALSTVAGYSTLDDGVTAWAGATKTPPTVDGNEFLTILGSGQVDVTAGVGAIFVHSFDVPGTAIVTVTATDPDTNQTISSQIPITIAGAASNKVPGAVTISQAAGSVYISGANGPQSKVVTATVLDGNGALIADPNDGQGHGWDNVQFQITGPAGADAKLSAINAAGVTQTGTTVVTSTHNGIASISFQAGAQSGPVQIKATVDRGDNNVDNQIQDAVTATATVAVSDGKLYALKISSPVDNAIHAFDTTVATFNADTGTYALIVTATATDRQGFPPAPGTVVRFGSVDTPQTNFNFDIEGGQGDPVEGGKTFSALDGHFITAGGGAGPGDTLIVFGKTEHGAPAGNADLESAVKLSQVVSQTQLNVATAFNFNETTGAVVNNGPVLPYLVGRSTMGNISSPAATDALGFASTTLNYPVTSLGRVVAVYAQGNGTDTVNNTTSVVTDAVIYRYPGIAAAKIVISPNPIPGNITVEVDVCVVDAKDNPLPGEVLSFGFTNLGVGSGTLDGIGSAGTVPDVTDASGCVATTVTTTGIAAATGSGTGASAPSLTFSIGTVSASAPITAGGGLVLLANPSACGGSGCTVQLTLLNSNGTPVPGVQLQGTCTGDSSIGLFNQPGITDSSGHTSASITANLNAYGSAKSGSCTFTTATGTPTAKVNLQGQDLCNGTSPAPPQCGTTTNSTIALTATSVLTNPASFTSAPSGLSCSAGAGATQPCSATVPGGTYTLTSSVAGNWSGSCTPVGTPPTVTATLIVPTAVTAGLTCTLTVP